MFCLLCRLEEDKVLLYDLLRAELFYPAHADVRQTIDVACQLGEIAAERFVTVLEIGSLRDYMEPHSATE